MVIPIDAERAFDKVQHPFMIETLCKVGIEGAFHIIIKGIYEIYNQYHTQWPKPKSFPLR